MKYLKTLILSLAVTGCLPDIPEVPTGAACTPDGWVMRISEDSDPLDWTTWEFVIDDQGAAFKCDFT